MKKAGRRIFLKFIEKASMTYCLYDKGMCVCMGGGLPGLGMTIMIENFHLGGKSDNRIIALEMYVRCIKVFFGMCLATS